MQENSRLWLTLLGLIAILTPLPALAQPGGPGPPPPQPLEPPPQPPGNLVTEAKARLGKALFWDEQVSSTRTVACGTCHRAQAGGGDSRRTLALNPGSDGLFGTDDDVVGSPGLPLTDASGAYLGHAVFGIDLQATGRQAPAATDAAYSEELFWDGRAGEEFRDPISGAVVLPAGAALESQALGPPLGDGEMAHVARNWNEVAIRVATSRPLALSPRGPADLIEWIGERSYAELFEEAFGTAAVTPARIAMAIATHERTLFSNQTPFDLSLGGGPNLSAAEQRGRGVFVDSDCASCHGAPLFTDNDYHFIGVRPASEDLGRFDVTSRSGDRGAFRTPGLRNVALRAPYFHDGSAETLLEVVEFYDRGGDFDGPNRPDEIRPLDLSDQEKADLVAFLGRPLTDPRVESGSFPFDEPGLYSDSSYVPMVLGVGRGGAGGVPRILAIEPPLAGNPSFTVAVDGALGGAAAVLVIDPVDPGVGPAPASAGVARIDVALGGAGDGQGFGSANVDLGEELAGAELFGRWYVTDPSAPDGVAVSRATRFIVFGPTARSGSDVIFADGFEDGFRDW